MSDTETEEEEIVDLDYRPDRSSLEKKDGSGICDIKQDEDRFSFVNVSTIPYSRKRLGRVDNLSREESEMILTRRDRLLDQWIGKDVRMASGGMTVWYMMECLALTEECKTIATEMRSTRNHNEKMSRKEVLEAEYATSLQNYHLTIDEWFGVHSKFHAIIVKELRVDSDNLEILDPFVIRNEWNIAKKNLS